MDLTSDTIGARLAQGGFDPAIAGATFARLVSGIAMATGRQPRRGLLLMGPPGTGKTTAARAIRRRGRSWFIMMSDPAAARMADPDSDTVMDYMADGNWVIDDLGREPQKNDYGIRAERFSHLIDKLYPVYQRGGFAYVPVITTNLTGQGIVERYDDHTASRLREMFVDVTFDGPDRRRAAL